MPGSWQFKTQQIRSALRATDLSGVSGGGFTNLTVPARKVETPGPWPESFKPTALLGSDRGKEHMCPLIKFSSVHGLMSNRGMICAVGTPKEPLHTPLKETLPAKDHPPGLAFLGSSHLCSSLCTHQAFVEHQSDIPVTRDISEQ